MKFNIYTEALPSNKIGNEVLDIVGANLTGLSLLSVPPSNLFHAIYTWTLQTEIGSYMGRIGQIPGEPHHLIVAFDNESDEVVGFLLYSPVPSDTEACGINYMAVKHTHRSRGIGSKMMRMVIERFPHVDLTCTVKMVSFYESLGFQIIGTHITQVNMNTRSYATKGLMAVLDVDQILRGPEVKSMNEQLIKRWGRRAVQDATKSLERHKDQLTRRTEAFVRSHIGAL